jgi:uncharacterized protein (DUF1330 family)|tara:strand:- start:409 stop:636 length:228 start_codon:yes stop_codon:yes gene_type:complete
MTVIIPTIVKYLICDYTIKGANLIAKENLVKKISGRTFTVVKEFTDIQEARNFIKGTDYFIQYVFKEIEPNESVH